MSSLVSNFLNLFKFGSVPQRTLIILYAMAFLLTAIYFPFVDLVFNDSNLLYSSPIAIIVAVGFMLLVHLGYVLFGIQAMEKKPLQWQLLLRPFRYFFQLIAAVSLIALSLAGILLFLRQLD